MERHHRRPVDLSEACSGAPDDVRAYLDSRDEPMIDTWLLITPMRQRQAKKYSAVPQVDLTAPLSDQIVQLESRLRVLEGRRRVNSAIHGVKVRQFIDADTFIEKYQLGHGIPDIQDWKLWAILDGIAHRSGRRVNHIEAGELARLITNGAGHQH